MGESPTLLYAGLLGLLYLVLSIRVVVLRRRHGVGLGSGGERELQRAIRAHANFAEYVPIAVLLIWLLDAGTAAPAWLVHLLGLALVVGRALHGLLGLNRSAGVSFGRFWGTVLTWIVILVSSLILVYMAFASWLV